APQRRFTSPIERANVSLPICSVVLIGSRKSPNDCLIPTAMARIRPPHIILNCKGVNPLVISSTH
ncbi:MAG: hypothetical protein VXW52_02620, partial [Pseudomonadota bacterium]|nr:hypothetical protein [Pseudomonadota bacterium]